MSFSEIELASIAERIVLAEIGNKDVESGYQHGFMIGFMEAFKLMDTIERKKELEKMVIQHERDEASKRSPNNLRIAQVQQSSQENGY